MPLLGIWPIFFYSHIVADKGILMVLGRPLWVREVLRRGGVLRVQGLRSEGLDEAEG